MDHSEFFGSRRKCIESLGTTDIHSALAIQLLSSQETLGITRDWMLGISDLEISRPGLVQPPHKLPKELHNLLENFRTARSQHARNLAATEFEAAALLLSESAALSESVFAKASADLLEARKEWAQDRCNPANRKRR